VNIPLLKPAPARLSGLGAELQAIEESGWFSNFGPMSLRLEREMTERLFGGIGGCLAVGNGTLALMLAIRYALGDAPPVGRYALMPSFTFAATAQAAIWNGLTPLFCDIDPDDWSLSSAAMEALLEQHGERIAVIVPYATFGNCIDLAHYARLTDRYGVPVVVDAAASLGSRDAQDRGFGTGFAQPIIFSMHATKPFATGEGGLIYCGDPSVVDRLRPMANFGFGEPRLATGPGLNAKFSEISALQAVAKLRGFEEVIAHRAAVGERYMANLNGWAFQLLTGRRIAHTFMPVLLPKDRAGRRREIAARLAERGIGTATYFSPHLAEHPYFKKTCVAVELPVTQDVADRIIVLPISDTITLEEIDAVCRALAEVVG
jgi:dTDP-4-amino-4,6-dideoxygalactose transaminase